MPSVVANNSPSKKSVPISSEPKREKSANSMTSSSSSSSSSTPPPAPPPPSSSFVFVVHCCFGPSSGITDAQPPDAAVPCVDDDDALLNSISIRPSILSKAGSPKEGYARLLLLLLLLPCSIVVESPPPSESSSSRDPSRIQSYSKESASSTTRASDPATAAPSIVARCNPNMESSTVSQTSNMPEGSSSAESPGSETAEDPPPPPSSESRR